MALITQGDFEQKTIYFCSSYKGGELPPLGYYRASENIPVVDDIYMEWTNDDGELKRGRRLIRYVPGERSIFADEQSEGAEKRLGKITMRKGFIPVDRREVTMVQFLRMCNYNSSNENRDESKNSAFYEVKPEAKSSKWIDDDNKITELKSQIHSMDKEELTVYAMLLEVPYKNVFTQDLKADLLIRAQNSPEKFLSIKNFPEMRRKYQILRAFEDGVLEQQGNDVCWSGGKKIITCPISEKPAEFLTKYTDSPVGYDIYKEILRKLNYTKPEKETPSFATEGNGLSEPQKKEDVSERNSVNPLGVLHDEGLKCGALVKKVQWYSLGDATKGSKYYNFALGKKNVITELKHNEKLRERLKELIDGSTNN